MTTPRPAALTAIAAAALFGAATPFAKLLLGTLTPFMVAALFYLGSGAGLGIAILARRQFRQAIPTANSGGIRAGEWGWLTGAILAGGVCGPALLMLGLAHTSAAASALLLNLEGVFTALIAWWIFRENADRQVVAGMMAIVAGGVLLSWQPGAVSVPSGALLIVAACLCWAVDNNLTRKVSAHDALLIACVKGLAAGSVNLAIALSLGARLPAFPSMAAAMVTGFAGYGVSLVLFVIALRNLGTARTGAYFSVAPLFGVAISLAIWPAAPPPQFWLAGALMALGVWLHIRERHEHAHTHEPLTHDHWHRHDAHHRHEHDFPYSGDAPHAHEHQHSALTHVHGHVPDVHHRHRH